MMQLTASLGRSLKTRVTTQPFRSGTILSRRGKQLSIIKNPPILNSPPLTYPPLPSTENYLGVQGTDHKYKKVDEVLDSGSSYMPTRTYYQCLFKRNGFLGKGPEPLSMAAFTHLSPTSFRAEGSRGEMTCAHIMLRRHVPPSSSLEKCENQPPMLQNRSHITPILSQIT